MSGIPSDPLEILIVVGGTITGTAVLVGGAVAFLWGRISGLYDYIDRNRKSADIRHEQNLAALEHIRICLARAGLWNGGPKMLPRRPKESDD